MKTKAKSTVDALKHLDYSESIQKSESFAICANGHVYETIKFHSCNICGTK